jgi:hypothetical protein
MSIFDEGFSIPAPSESPAEGHETEAAEDLDPEDPYNEDQDDEIEEADPEEEIEEDPDEEEEADPDEDGNSDPKLLAGKYKNVDELLKGYQNLQREFTKSRQPQGQQQPASQTPVQPVGTPEQSKQFWDVFQQNPLGTMQYLIDNAVAARTAPINEQRESDVLSRNIESLSKEFKQVGTEDGMKQLFGKVAEIAEEMGNPNLAKSPSPRILRMAATEAFGDTKQAVYNKAKQQGRNEAEAARAAKKGLPAARTGSKPKVTNQQQLSPEDEIRQGIMAANGRGGRSLLS